MSKNNIWYLPGPFHRYQEDVKALAKEHGLVIVDANVAPNRNGEADDVPKVTIREGLRPAAKRENGTEEDREAMDVAELKARLDEAGVTYRANASKESLQKQVAELNQQ